MMDKVVTVKELADYFHLEHLTGDEEALKRTIHEQDVSRPGFELSGYVRSSDPERIVILGNKEIEYMNMMDQDELRHRCEYITGDMSPMIVIAQNHPLPKVLEEVAIEKNFPIFRTPHETARIMVDIITYLDEKLANEDTLYGVLLVVYGRGVLLTGDSGIGKSETALELIQEGQALVADDRVDIIRVHNSIIGTAPNILKGLLEIRGIGIIDIEKMYGAISVIDKHQIDMVVDLTNFNDEVIYDRLGDLTTSYTEILGIQIPTVKIPVSSGRSTSVLVKAAVNNLILEEKGYNSSATFKENLNAFIADNKRNKE